MADSVHIVDEALWGRLLTKVQALPPQRQEEIIDYIDFILDKAEDEAWDLTVDEQQRMDRLRAGDLSDTVALADVEDAIRRGAIDEL